MALYESNVSFLLSSLMIIYVFAPSTVCNKVLTLKTVTKFTETFKNLMKLDIFHLIIYLCDWKNADIKILF